MIYGILAQGFICSQLKTFPDSALRKKGAGADKGSTMLKYRRGTSRRAETCRCLDVCPHQCLVIPPGVFIGILMMLEAMLSFFRPYWHEHAAFQCLAFGVAGGAALQAVSECPPSPLGWYFPPVFPPRFFPVFLRRDLFS